MTDQADGLRKSAILLRSLEEDDAREILRRLRPEEAEQLRRELGAVGRLPDAVVDAVLNEFCAEAAPRHQVDETPQDLPCEPSPFSSLHVAESESVLDLLRDEHPQTVALILAHLPADKAGEVLERLPIERQIDVVKRIAGIEQTSPAVIREVERRLQQRIGCIISRSTRSTSDDGAAEALDRADRAAAVELLHGVVVNSSELEEQMQRVQADGHIDAELCDDEGMVA